MREPALLEPFNQQMEIQLPLYEMNYNLDYSSQVLLVPVDGIVDVYKWKYF